ncbi:MAG: hypothetical protein Q8N51_16745 [Gammaproteobacteria bacterium]|nr:hypothetical protein [Gammaproteobacteria bacterium]
MGKAGHNSALRTGVGRHIWRWATRRIWLPKLLYEALPWIYCGLGAYALAAGLFLPNPRWLLPYLALLGAACLHIGLWCVVLRRRYRCRSLRRERERRIIVLS